MEVDEYHQKAVGQLKLALNDVFSCFRMYGLEHQIPGAVDEVVELAEQFARRLAREDVPIKLLNQRNVRYRR